MISEERVKYLWLHRDNIHDGDLVAQLCDLARKIEVEVATPLVAMIKELEQESAALALQYKQMREALDSVATELGYDWLREEFDAAREALALTDLSTSIIQQHDNDVIERFAHECEEFADAYLRTAQGNNDGMYDHMESAARELAEAIRALKG